MGEELHGGEAPAGDKEEGRMMFLASLGTNNGGLPIQA
jgi:hypothetical protein